MDSRVIRVDQQVWSELQKRAVPFIEKNPNSTLRRILGLSELKERESSRGRSADEDTYRRITELVDEVGEWEGKKLMVKITSRGSFQMRFNQGKVFGYIYRQDRKQRLVVEVRKDWAQRSNLTSWERESPNAWFNTGSSCYWDIPYGIDEVKARHRVADVLRTLMKMSQ